MCILMKLIGNKINRTRKLQLLLLTLLFSVLPISAKENECESITAAFAERWFPVAFVSLT